MKLLRELMRRQEQHGFLSEPELREIARQFAVPLYRVEELVSFYPIFRRNPPPRCTVEVCRDVACAMRGSRERYEALRREMAGQADVEVREVSCVGRCDTAPALTINDQPVAELGLAELVAKLRQDGEFAVAPPAVPGQAWRCDPYATGDERYATVRRLARESDVNCGPLLTEAGLRGMGGAGFPTGRKWDMVRSTPAVPKYVICNADESEPGTFKDRVILEQLPHLVVEGMLLAALTVGAEHGIIYLRHEYGAAHEALEAELATARQRGVLGDNAAGSGRPFNIEIFVSPGGYILGEETALLEALEDRRGEPRLKPPYPATHGLWGQPTLINNVETLALATCIVARGVAWWRQQGRAGRAGLKFVSISGDVQRPGVYEIALGTPLRELVELAGGLPVGVSLQALLPGGASSLFLSPDKLDTPFDFDDLKAAGSMLGTGGLIVIGDQHRLFDLAVNLVRFFRNESCGKCVPCRVGSEKAVQLLEQVQRQECPEAALDVLPELASTLEQTSICGLGQVALNPYLSWKSLRK